MCLLVVVITLLCVLCCYHLKKTERVSFAAVLGFIYTAGAVLVRGIQVG